MLDLAAYDVDPERGFLPAEDPLIELPPEFAEWNHLGAELPYLLLTGRVRSTLVNMQTPDLSLLKTNGELERAMQILSYLGMAYIWGEQPPIDTVPAAIAVPWAAVADRLGRPPIVTHCSAVLNNWRRIDKGEGISAENIANIQHFLGGMDEQWFFTATVALEAIGAAALQPLVDAKAAANSGDVDTMARSLAIVRDVFKKVTVALLRTYERCDPHIFYYRIRPFLAGWNVDGLIFEGVSETPLKLNGASAAQSSLIQAYDAALGIEHLHPETQPFLTMMRDFMPPNHRRFVEDLGAGASVYDFVQANKTESPQLADVFDQCIDELDEFRRTHQELAVRFVLKAARDGGEDGLGTGGTSFVPFLAEARKETKAKRTNKK
ncbi:MAG: hypothetical protein ACPG8W_26340 [Candidatus Promineifilaceae bacterium]